MDPQAQAGSALRGPCRPGGGACQEREPEGLAEHEEVDQEAPSKNRKVTGSGGTRRPGNPAEIRDWEKSGSASDSTGRPEGQPSTEAGPGVGKRAGCLDGEQEA